jgi:hypothetical protein
MRNFRDTSISEFFNNIDVFRSLNIATMAVGAAVLDRRKADESPEGGLLENSRCELAC